jgi:hypothetical protein
MTGDTSSKNIGYFESLVPRSLIEHSKSVYTNTTPHC